MDIRRSSCGSAMGLASDQRGQWHTKKRRWVVICEEKRGFWHQVKICPKEAFDAEQRECEAFRFSLSQCAELFTTKTNLLCPPHSSTQRSRAFSSSDLRVLVSVSQNRVVKRLVGWKKISARLLVKTNSSLVQGATIGCAVSKPKSKPE